MTGDASGDLTGQKLGNYRVDSVLGTGGMSVMYKATDVRLGRKVALKVIGEHLGADAEFRERFVDEARNTSAIDHANIVPVYDFGELDGMLYIAMRLVDGADLASRIGGSAMEPDRAVRLLEQVADALDTLHERGLVHLDMKPANVLVTGKESVREHVYIADFGLTRRGATGHRTRGGDFLGSPTYAAPEHLRGEPLDGRTDQYALACVAYACLTGNPPYRGEVSEVIKGHLNGQPPSVSRGTGLPAAVDDAVAQGMAKSPDDRYDTCSELVAAVRTALRAAPPQRQTPPPPQGPDRAAGSAGRNTPPTAAPPDPRAPRMPPPGQAPPSPGQAPPPQGSPPQGVPQPPPARPTQPRTPPPGFAAPGPGQGPAQQHTPRPPGQTPPMPPGYGAGSGPDGAGFAGRDGRDSGTKKAWTIGGIAIGLVVLATVLIIVFVGGSDGGDESGTGTAPSTGNSAPRIPVGPSGSQGGSAGGDGQQTPPATIPVVPGN